MRKINILLIIFLLGLVLTGCNKKPGKEDEEDMENEHLKELPYYDYLNKNNPLVTITVKDFGVMELELFPDVASISVDNFIRYIESESYTNSTFHRIIKNFMVQGGMVKETFPPIKGEFNSNGVKNDLKHYRGVISMARTMVPNSATSQFFIVHKTSSHLDGEYAGFGGLISGFDVLDALASVKTGGSFDAPLNEVLIESIVVDLRGYESK